MVLGWSEVELPQGAKCTVRTGSGACRLRWGCRRSPGLRRESQEEVKGGWVESVAGDLSQDDGKEPKGKDGARRGRWRSVSNCSLEGSWFSLFLFFFHK